MTTLLRKNGCGHTPPSTKYVETERNRLTACSSALERYDISGEMLAISADESLPQNSYVNVFDDGLIS